MNFDFSKLEVLSKTLQDKSDGITRSLQVVENKLKTLNLGVTAWYIETQHDSWMLGYGKLESGDWGLIAKFPAESYQEEATEETTKPLLGCTREIRIEAIRKIPGLLNALEQAAQIVLARIDEARPILSEISEAMKEQP